MDFNENLKNYIKEHLKPVIFDDVELLEVAKGRVVISLAVNEKLFNAYGIVHGGLLFTLCDTCAGITGNTLGKKSVTLQAGINYIKSVNTGNIRAISEVLHNGGSTIVINVKAYNDDDQLLADSNYTMYVIDK